jgi:TrmH family RNA methyltransferase
MAGSRGDVDRVVLEGFHPLKHALRFGAAIDEIVAADPPRLEAMGARHAPDILPALRDLPLRIVDEVELARLVGGRSHGSPDVVAYARRPELDVRALLDVDDAPIVLLEEPTHLGNIGAVVRVAAAAGAAAVVTTGALDPWHPAALRGSAGLHFALAVARLDLDEALAFERTLVAADPDGDTGLAPLPPRALLALGSERRGLSPRVLGRAAVRVRIPMREGVSSLNLATAAAVLLYAGR